MGRSLTSAPVAAVKSVQRGQTSSSAATVTIAAVNPAKSVLHYNSRFTSGGSTGTCVAGYASLQDATTISLSYGVIGTAGAASADTVNWQVIEYY